MKSYLEMHILRYINSKLFYNTFVSIGKFIKSNLFLKFLSKSSINNSKEYLFGIFLIIKVVLLSS